MKNGYRTLLDKGFRHYEKLHELFRGQVATRGLAINSPRPPTHMKLDSMVQDYRTSHFNRRSGKQSLAVSQESTSSSYDISISLDVTSPPQPRDQGKNKRSHPSAICSDPVIGEALDLIKEVTLMQNSKSPRETLTTKKVRVFLILTRKISKLA